MTVSRIPGLYRMSLRERHRELVKKLDLNDGDLDAFVPESGLSIEASDVMVENAIGVLGLPVGAAANFVINGQPVVVPMAIEEPSVVAASSHMAKLVGTAGGFRADVDDPVMIGQIQILDVSDLDRARNQIESNQKSLLVLANTFCEGMVSRGGGCIDIVPRILPPSPDETTGSSSMLVVHVHINCCDAMGANVINTVVEGLGPHISSLVGGRLGFRILSNLADRRLARAYCELPYRLLATDTTRDDGREIASRIVEGYRLACRDPYRACTHNKGIMNGIDAVAIATGNDWRAIEAGAHAYACKDGSYSSLSHFALDDKKATLVCKIELPLAVGVVGGSTRMHPTVNASLKMLGEFGQSAKKLAGLMAAVGLAQNLGALRAIACEGIQQGHMALHQRKNHSISSRPPA